MSQTAQASPAEQDARSDPRPTPGTNCRAKGTNSRAILAVLFDGPATGSKLVRLLGARRATVHAAIRALREAGQVEREGPTRGRGGRYRLTGLGRDEHARESPAYPTCARPRITPAELAELAASLGCKT